MNIQTSESVTENIFRNFYGTDTFIEKSAINNDYYGFQSKSGEANIGYPDFLKDTSDYVIVVEAKSLKQSEAESDVQLYMKNNKIHKDIIGIAVSGQHLNQIKVSYFYKLIEDNNIAKLQVKDKLLTLGNLDTAFKRKKHGETITDDELIKVIKGLNEQFHSDNKVRSSNRSLFFSGLMIALTNNTFRNIYKNIQPPTKEEVATTDATVLEAHYLNEHILNAISTQLNSKINSLSKMFNWKDRFSFIRNVDYSLNEYKKIIAKIEKKIYIPFSNEEKQDILGRAYKIFLSRAGKTENKNIILTPDHIKELMVKLSRLKADDVVLDTCMGSGGFLMESMEVMSNLAKDDPEKNEKIRREQLIGFENDSVLFALACSNMFLHGDGRSHLLFRSSLLYSDSNGQLINSNDEDLLAHIRDSKPTKCIINPPYESNSPIKFTLQALRYLEDNGKLVIIMPTPTLTKHKDDLTKTILEIAKLDYVIKMPYTLFNEQSRTVNTSIFGFTKTPHDINDEVMFYNLSDDGFVSVQHKGRVDKFNKWNDIENTVIDAINNSHEIKGVSKKKKIYRIVEDENGEVNAELTPSGVEKPSPHTTMVKMGDLFHFEDGTLQSTKNDENGIYNFITASDEWKTHTDYTHDTEALIYATQAGGSLGKSQYVNGKFIASNLSVILTPKKDSGYDVNLQFYNILLNKIKDQLVNDLADGTSKLTLNPTDLKEYYIEYIDIDVQNNFVNKYINKRNNLQKQLDNLEKDMDKDINNILEN